MYFILQLENRDKFILIGKYNPVLESDSKKEKSPGYYFGLKHEFTEKEKAPGKNICFYYR